MRLARQDRGEAFLYELLAHPIDHRRARLQLFDDLAVAQAFARLGNVRLQQNMSLYQRLRLCLLKTPKGQEILKIFVPPP